MALSSSERKIKKQRRVFIVMEVTIEKRSSPKRRRHSFKPRQIMLKAVPEAAAPDALQRKFFEGDTIELGDDIGTCLGIEFPEWTPMFRIGGSAYGPTKSKKKN